VLNIKEIVKDAMSFPGCKIAVYVDKNMIDMYLLIAYYCDLNMIQFQYKDNFVLKILGHGEIYLLKISDMNKAFVYDFYKSHVDSEARPTIGEYGKMLLRNKQKKPKTTEHVVSLDVNKAINDINNLVAENKEFFAPQETGTSHVRVAFNKLTELIKADKNINKAQTFQGHKLQVGMVFEHKDGSIYTLNHNKKTEDYFLYGDGFTSFPFSRNINNIFGRNEDMFRLVSVPVEKGKVYKKGQRFSHKSGIEYLLCQLTTDTYSLINVKSGNRFNDPAQIENIFMGKEEEFSLLVD